MSRNNHELKNKVSNNSTVSRYVCIYIYIETRHVRSWYDMETGITRLLYLYALGDSLSHIDRTYQAHSNVFNS
jgi:hypothetical protein